MYIATYLMDIIALIFLMVLIYSSTSIHRYRKRPFAVAVLLTIFIILSEAGTLYNSYFGMHQRVLHVLFNVMGFALTPMLPMVLALIFDREILKKHRLILLPTFINLMASVLSGFMNVIFYIDAFNGYSRGTYFFIFTIVYCSNFLFLVVCTINLGHKNNYPMKRKLLAMIIFIILGTSVQILRPDIYSSWHSVTLALFLYYFIMSDFDSSFDTLTGLYNRSNFEKKVVQKTEKKPYSVIMLDINDFKLINDTYGHDYGDEVIKKVAAVIRKNFPKPYTCFRYGGDEFSILSPIVDVEEIDKLLRNMMLDLERPFKEEGILPSVSFGYSVSKGGDFYEFKDRLKEADERMYLYKNNLKIMKRINRDSASMD